jgi:hypothetical protein
MAIKIKIFCVLIAALLCNTDNTQAVAGGSLKNSMVYPIENHSKFTRRQLAQYDFLQRHLEPDVVEENPMIRQIRIWFKTGVVYSATVLIAYAAARLVWMLPTIQSHINELEQPIIMSKISRKNNWNLSLMGIGWGFS